MSNDPAKPRSLYELFCGPEEHENQVKQEKIDLAKIKESIAAEDDAKKS